MLANKVAAVGFGAVVALVVDVRIVVEEMSLAVLSNGAAEAIVWEDTAADSAQVLAVAVALG